MSLLLLIILNEFLVIFGTHYTDKWAVKIKGGEAVARKLSEKYGFIYLGKIIPDVYHFQHKDVQKRSAHPSAKHHQLLFEDPEVLWTEQQIVKRRVSRSMNTEKREFNTLYSSPNFPNDPKWKNMWYLNGDSDYNMRIRDTWTLGYTGKGVVVTVVDDGIEINHADLKQNYDAEASYDVNDHDLDPTPRYDYSDVNRQV
ncbi:hypothetical protein KUTeg_017708 [Tegillarca granosa]|uniref:Uncharacterized protein n=1 Tax=Tegillarca granosa TaxID=220873 RepID=A0ABQ9EL54_TEGGR|nr:hypothetical protein KUTeg_017708 [Tegillarca granosa]